jgi:drug/metabolite transporter (DMT)-like permease
MSLHANPTFIGSFSVVWWGMAIVIARVFQTETSFLIFAGIFYSTMTLFGFLNLKYRKTDFDRAMFKNPFFYWRGFFMCLHVLSFMVAIYWVQTKYIPVVILLNYFWPTAVILFSVLIAGVPITRWKYFLVGLIIILTALTIELAGSLIFSSLNDLTAKDYTSFIVAFIGANSWGVYSALSRKYGSETGGGSAIPFYQMMLTPFLALAFVFDFEIFISEALTIFYLVIYSFFGFLAYMAWDYGMRKGNVVILSLFADFIPWLSLIFAALILKVEIGPKTILSAILLVLGAMITRYGTLALDANFFGVKKERSRQAE